MKKIIALILAVLMLVSFAACGTNKSESSSNDSSSSKNTSSNSSENTTSENDNGEYVAYTYEDEPKDLLTIEEIVLIPAKTSEFNYLKWKMKVRNTSGEDIKMGESSMRIWYNYLDSKGDKIWHSFESAGYSSTIKDGQAEWIEMSGYPSEWSNRTAETFTYLEIYGYTISLNGVPDHEFSDSIKINIKDYFEWESIA